MNRLPKISLITPSYQQAQYLEETITSVLDQGYPDLEYIVMDGGSTDGSVEIIKKYAKHLTHWTSEKDKGQSDAINKGVQISTGIVFNWLNSDDRLLPGALKRVGEAFASNDDLICYGGRINHFDETSTRPFALLNDASDRYQLLCDPVINQMATFFKASLVRNIGLNSALHYAMDYELWLSVLLTEPSGALRFDDTLLADFRMHELQKTGHGFAPFVHDIANILAGMATKAGDDELAQILLMAHNSLPQYQCTVPSTSDDAERVRKMAVHFMLKWHHIIYNAEELRMMKHFVKWYLRYEVPIHPTQLERAAKLEEQVSSPNWLAFRLQRKLKHLRS